MKNNKEAFTLVEIIVWIVIFTSVIMVWFQSLTSINIWKIKLLQKTDLTKDANFFAEKLFLEIKRGWVIDYEEYFNRKVVWTSIENGHYRDGSGFWNFWQWWTVWTTTYWGIIYLCRSITGAYLRNYNWEWGCYSAWNTWYAANNDQWWWFPVHNAWMWNLQRYWQYAYQFIDYNVDANNDSWDSDWNNYIVWDFDDEDIWIGPKAFVSNTNLNEIYLIWNNWKSRTYIRRKTVDDTDAPTTKANCTSAWTEEWCRWTLQILKLVWKDWWVNHNWTWDWRYDWIIDTWILDPEVYWTWKKLPNDSVVADRSIVAWSVDMEPYRQDLFSWTLNVTNFEIYMYPDIYWDYAWNQVTSANDINPYLRLKLSVEPSWRKKRWINTSVMPKINYQTTVNLIDYLD